MTHWHLSQITGPARKGSFSQPGAQTLLPLVFRLNQKMLSNLSIMIIVDVAAAAAACPATVHLIAVVSGWCPKAFRAGDLDAETAPPIWSAAAVAVAAAANASSHCARRGSRRATSRAHKKYLAAALTRVANGRPRTGHPM